MPSPGGQDASPLPLPGGGRSARPRGAYPAAGPGCPARSTRQPTARIVAAGLSATPPHLSATPQLCQFVSALRDSRVPALARQATVRVSVAGLSATPPRLSATSEPATPTASISSSPSASSGRLLCSDLDFICSFRGILFSDAVRTAITIQVMYWKLQSFFDTK
ncbi:uncharacterized protein LOC120664593 isoform X2 [Panicum virgatum]|uniref:uncharacterized protein LOC120664593 isoform X2 n=1 Tax=Panicum virgatum TaxID=38727 RepID=UPI0019D52641|nr:uncharacterized protein LOC120664593 isoform X2 [Panicum virgatum]